MHKGSACMGDRFGVQKRGSACKKKVTCKKYKFSVHGGKVRRASEMFGVQQRGPAYMK